MPSVYRKLARLARTTWCIPNGFRYLSIGKAWGRRLKVTKAMHLIN